MLAAVISSVSIAASADWPHLTPEELARQSELIVVGEYLGQDLVRLEGNAINIGVVRVDSVLKGEGAQAVVLLQLPHRPKGLVASTDVPLQKGQRGLWYLRKKSEGLYLVDRPDRFVAMEAAGPRIRSLKR
jgi:hypothetical protein